MAPVWRLRRGSEKREGPSNDGHADAGTGNPDDAPLDDDLDGDDGAPESLDFQTIYNAAFELRRSSLDPGRRAAFESVESLDVSVSAAAAVAAETEASASASAAGGDGVSPAAAAELVAVGSSGDTSAELNLREKPFLGCGGWREREEKRRKGKRSLVTLFHALTFQKLKQKKRLFPLPH